MRAAAAFLSGSKSRFLSFDRGSWFIRLLKDPAGLAGLTILVVVVVISVFPTQLAPHDPLEPTRNTFATPSLIHPFGTDNLGRDELSRIIYGARSSMQVASTAILMAIVLGSVIGLVSGYVGGWLDLLSQRIVDAWQAFPTLILAIAIVSVFRPGIWTVAIAIGTTMTPGIVRVVRSSTITQKNLAYIEAAVVIGVPQWKILTRHILPNITAPILVLGSVDIGTAILAEASLGFLGIGVAPPAISWGSMLSRTGLKFLETAPMLAVYPGLAIGLTVFGVNILGDALRDVLDPRLRQR